MSDEDRALEIARLQQQLADAKAERARLAEDLVRLAAHIHEIRAAFGNPFYYSHPEYPDEGIANYTGGRSHEVGMSTLQDFLRVEREIASLNERLGELGGSAKGD